MDSQEVLETTMASRSTDEVNNLKSKKAENSIENGDSLNVDILEDLDTFMDDVDNRIRIARMVSDSLIKGMVSAVEQESDEKIRAKEIELENLKSNRDQHESTVDLKRYETIENACLKHDEMKESVTDEFKKLRNQIEGLKGCNIKRNGSCHEIVGLGGILKEDCELEKTVDNLEMMMKNMSKLVDTMLIFSKASVNESQHERELKEELEDMVMQSSIKSIHEEFQEVGNLNMVLAEKFNNISDLRNELESLTNLLPSCDSGNLISHNSFDVDNTHGNPLRSQLSTKWEENGESNKSKSDFPDCFDANSLSHLNNEGMVKFFNNLILKLKREHEAEVHQITDNYISLKGKYLSERRSFVLPNKEFEVLKKKIPEVVSKLDGILSESDEFIKKGDHFASVNTLLRENHQLRDLLAVKKDEIKHLSSQITVVSEKNHESLMADTFLEASIEEDVYKCFIRELNRQIEDIKDESDMKIVAMQDIYEVLLQNSQNSSICAIEETFMESLFTQELLETVFKENLTDIEKKFETLHTEYITARENLLFIEKKATKLEAELILEGEEREKLRNEVNLLRNLLEKKETLANDELNNLRKQANWQETLISKTNKEVDEMREKFSKAEEQILSDKMEINLLNQKLGLAVEEISGYKKTVFDLFKEKERFVELIEAKEKEHRKQMEAVVVLVDELSTKFSDFECRVTMDVLSNKTRLENSKSELSSVINSANEVKSSGILYKQKLEKKCHDLQMAENEVDLLGDEVDTLLGLLEKIYIALDHYSPVLQHYPGVIEILELVRRELSGESLKSL